MQKLVDAENHDIELAALLSGITVLDERKPKKKILSMYDATSKTNREKTVKHVVRRFSPSRRIIFFFQILLNETGHYY